MSFIREIMNDAIKIASTHKPGCSCRKCDILRLKNVIWPNTPNINPLTGDKMPEKKIPNHQMCTAKHAIGIFNAFSRMGVPVYNLLENNLTEGEVVVLNNPNFEDDGGQHQYLMNLFGKQMVVTMADEFMRGPGGTYECLVHLASQAVVNSSVAPGQNQATSLTFQQAEEVIFALPGFSAKLDTALNYIVVE